jgi:hypothetical protein
MQVTPSEFDCSGKPPPREEESPPAAEDPVAEETAVIEPEPEVIPKAEELPTPEPEEEPVTEDGQAPLEIEVLPPIEKDFTVSSQEEEESGRSDWLWLVAAVVLFGLGFGLHLLRQARREESTGGAEGASATPASALEAEEEEPVPSVPLPDSLLLIHGVLANGTEFEDSCAVSKNAINIVIGRGDADLVIDSLAVSRKQVSLNGTINELMVADLGSSNGTSVNGVPCLEGEIMFIEPGDTLILGDARCSLEIRPRHTAGSEKA